MRGKVGSRVCSKNQLGITPACAGKSGRHALRHVLDGDHPRMCGKSAGTGSRSGASWDHPRVCGEKTPVQVMVEQPKGSPPHVRGKGPAGQILVVSVGITPAYAGKSSPVSGCPAWCKDHPRVCGEKMFGKNSNIQDVGSPPRMRGKAQAEQPLPHVAGITPARAGKSVRRENSSS